METLFSFVFLVALAHICVKNANMDIVTLKGKLNKNLVALKKNMFFW